MKAFICDWCGSSITDPYQARYREFVCSYSWDEGITQRFKIHRKLHMCNYCYTQFKQIIINKSCEKRNKE